MSMRTTAASSKPSERKTKPQTAAQPLVLADHRPRRGSGACWGRPLHPRRAPWRLTRLGPRDAQGGAGAWAPGAASPPALAVPLPEGTVAAHPPRLAPTMPIPAALPPVLAAHPLNIAGHAPVAVSTQPPVHHASIRAVLSHGRRNATTYRGLAAAHDAQQKFAGHRYHTQDAS